MPQTCLHVSPICAGCMQLFISLEQVYAGTCLCTVLQGSLTGFKADIRKHLCAALSDCTIQPQDMVSLEGIRALPKPDSGIRVTLHVQLGQPHHSAEQLATSWKSTLLEMMNKAESMTPVMEAVGPVDADSLQMQVLDVTPREGRAQEAAPVNPLANKATSAQLIEVAVNPTWLRCIPRSCLCQSMADR